MSDFDHFWEIYPKKMAKIPAQRAWERLTLDKKRIAYADIKKGRYSDTEKAYIPNAATYLNQERWEDEIIEQPRQKEEWEFIPKEDDKLVSWARKHGFGEPNERDTYFQYRQKLGQKIKQRLEAFNKDGDK